MTGIGVKPTLRTERKKDGRIFYYLSFNKFDGAAIISDILSKLPIEELRYKLWSSETSQRWRTLQEQWKSEGCEKDYKSWARGKI